MSVKNVALRPALSLIAAVFFAFAIVVGASSAAFASSVTIEFGAGGNGNGKVGADPGDETTHQPTNTGGQRSQVDYVARCGFISMTAKDDGLYYQNCKQNKYEYFPIQSDADLRFWIGTGNVSGFDAGLVGGLTCAPDGQRQKPGKTLVGYGVSYQEFWSNYYDRNPDTNRPIYMGSYSPMMNATLQSVTCNYQTWEDDEDRICVVSVDLKLDKTRPNRLGILNDTAPTPWGAGNHTLEACRNSSSLYASRLKNLGEFGYGQFEGTTRVNYQRVTVRTYNNAPPGHSRPADRIVRIHGVTSRPGPSIYAQQTCDPAHTRGGTNRNAVFTGGPWSWTESDCPDPTPPGSPGGPGTQSYQCTNVHTATINGRSGVTSATVFRDAADNRITWNSPSITADNLVSVTPKDTKVTRSGTPWNTPRTMPVGKNNVTLETTSGTNVFAKNGTWMNGRQADFNFTANWASNDGAPTVITPTWRFDTVLNKRAVELVGVRVGYSGGSWTIRPDFRNSTYPIRSTATCNGQVSIDVVRAVNDS